MADVKRFLIFTNFIVLLLIITPLSAEDRFENLKGKGSYIYPLMDARLSGKFGNRYHPIKRVQRHHSGLDLAAPRFSPIRAMAAGLVIFSDPLGGYGNMVVIKHADGTTSHYGHNTVNLVKPGETVQAGQIIAQVGSTGLSTGPHLHLEIRKEGKAMDPLKIFPGLTSKAKG